MVEHGRVHDPAAVAKARKRLLPAAAESLLRPLSAALCDPVRLKIVLALSGSELTVKDLARVIGRSQSVTSQHLRVLRDIGAVTPHRIGRRVVYSLAPDGLGPPLRRVLTTLARVAN